MSLAPHTVRRPKGAVKGKVRVGRGNASGKGTYSARGMKGQRARAGGRRGLARLGFKQTLQRIPKKRGFKSAVLKPAAVTISALSRVFDDGAVITPEALRRCGLVETVRHGVKIIGNGEVRKKFDVRDCRITPAARESIARAGGTVTP